MQNINDLCVRGCGRLAEQTKYGYALTCAECRKTSDYARKLGSSGGKKSVQSRFNGKTKEQISELMRKVRLSKAESKDFSAGLQDMVNGMRKNI